MKFSENIIFEQMHNEALKSPLRENVQQLLPTGAKLCLFRITNQPIFCRPHRQQM
jgi:hypothetical protein